MAADTKAPRVARSITNMEAAAMAARAASGSAAALLDFSINGMVPFGHTPHDAAQTLIRQLSGLLTVLGAGHEDVDEAERAGIVPEALAGMTGSLNSAAFDGLNSLAALAAFFLDQHRGAN